MTGLDDTDSSSQVRYGVDTPTAHSSPNPALLPADQAVTQTHMSNPPSQTQHLLQNVTHWTMGEKFTFLLFRHFPATAPHHPCCSASSSADGSWEHQQF